MLAEERCNQVPGWYDMRKEERLEVKKVWGEEIWLVNNDMYCGKLLLLDKNAVCSYHYHKVKKETFMALEGYAMLTIEGKDYILAPFTRARTIEPYEKHKFTGIESAVILEVSTHHDEDDVVRLSESIAGHSDVPTLQSE